MASRRRALIEGTRRRSQRKQQGSSEVEAREATKLKLRQRSRDDGIRIPTQEAHDQVHEEAEIEP